MKKLIYCALALATGLFAASCQQENLEPVQGGNTVTFEVSVPEVATKGIGDNVSNINDLVYAVYWTEAESLLQLQESPELQRGLNLLYQKNYTVDPFNGTGSTTVNVELLNDKNYVVLFWAQHDDVWVAGQEFDLREVTYPANMAANNNDYAAFSEVSFISKNNLAGKKDVTLKRPFAQLNIGTTLPNPENFSVSIAGTSVKVKNAGTSFNLIKQVAEGEGEVSFAEAGAPTNPDREDGKLVVNNTPYTYAAMNYVFANGNVEVDYVINLGDYHGTVKNTVSEVPVAANYRTNIIGNLLTATSEYSVVLDQVWGTPETNVEVVAVSTAEDLIDAVNNIQDGAEGNIILEDNIDLGALAGMISTKAAAPTYGLLIPAGKSLVLDLNGLTLSQMVECTTSYNMIENHGKLVIADSKGNGKISFMDLSQGGSSTWGSYVIGNQTGAELTLESGTIEHLGSKNWTDRPTNLPIQNYAGKVTINGGALKSPSFRSLRDFTAGGEIIINGGKFEGQVWMQGLGSGSSSLTVNGGDFYPTLDYDGSCIYITNGTNDVEVYINGGMFNTKIGCADAQKPGVNGCIKGGIFTTTAIKNTNSALIANGYATKQNEEGNWVIVPAPVKVDGGYEISNAAQLRYLAESINAGNSLYNNTNIFLTADIELQNETWLCIGTEANPFSGTFEGNGKTIKNLTIIEEEAKEGKAFIGFFGYAKNATIKDVTFENVNLNIACLDIDHSQGHIGAVAGSLEGTSTIENVTVKGDIKVESTVTANGASRVAVVAGGNSYGNVTMKNVHVIANEGSYLKANNNLGALAGQLQGKSVFENCSSNIDVTGTKFFAGGIIGLAAGDQTFTNCHTTGKVAITAGREGRNHDQYRVGGIAGGWADGAKNVCTLTNCSYTGNISGTNSDGSIANPLDYAGYVGRGYTLNGCAGSKVVIDGVEYVQAYNTAAEAGIYIVNGALVVNSAAALRYLANKVNSGEDYFEGKTVKLGADIDLNNEEWTPIGSAYKDHGFMGNFDGNGYIIKNLKITALTPDADNYVYAGLFGVTEGTDKDNQNNIKNLVIENVTIDTEGHIAAAAIAYPYYTAVENIIVKGNISIKGGDYTSGALAYTRRCVDAKNVTVAGNDGSTIEGNQTIGGVISDIQTNGGLIANYSNFKASGLTIKGVKQVGGISGIISLQTLDGATVENVTLVCNDSRTGIVAGALGGVSTIKNINTNNVTGATNLVGATYDNGGNVVVDGDVFTAQN